MAEMIFVHYLIGTVFSRSNAPVVGMCAFGSLADSRLAVGRFVFNNFLDLGRSHPFSRSNFLGMLYARKDHS